MACHAHRERTVLNRVGVSAGQMHHSHHRLQNATCNHRPAARSHPTCPWTCLACPHDVDPVMRCRFPSAPPLQAPH